MFKYPQFATQEPPVYNFSSPTCSSLVQLWMWRGKMNKKSSSVLQQHLLWIKISYNQNCFFICLFLLFAMCFLCYEITDLSVFLYACLDFLWTEERVNLARAIVKTIVCKARISRSQTTYFHAMSMQSDILNLRRPFSIIVNHDSWCTDSIHNSIL